jgi:hypothetical protein
MVTGQTFVTTSRSLRESFNRDDDNGAGGLAIVGGGGTVGSGTRSSPEIGATGGILQCCGKADGGGITISPSQLVRDQSKSA